MKLRDLLESSDPYLTKQRKDFDCGVATTYSILDYFDKDTEKYLSVQKHLKTKEATGTSPEMIKTVLNSYEIFESDTGPVGYILLNVEKLYNDFPEDGQNGHWSFIEKVDDGILLYDVWADKIKKYKSIDEILVNCKDILVGDKVYNDYYRFVDTNI